MSDTEEDKTDPEELNSERWEGTESTQDFDVGDALEILRGGDNE